MTETSDPHSDSADRSPLTVTIGDLELTVTGEPPSISEAGDGIVEIVVEGSQIRVDWRIPCLSVVAYWTPTSTPSHWLPPAWSAPRTVSLTSGAPVATLIGVGDRNRCTVAALQTDVTMGGGVVEETGEFEFSVQGEGALRLRIDTSDRHYATCLAEVATWWQGDHTIDVPITARMPAYSTWYAMHQSVTPERIEEQARLAKSLGCDSVIVDDGWMTTDRQRGYAFTGDWEPVSLPEVAAHVKRVQALGLAYLLWYAPPFVGRESASWEDLHRYALTEAGRMNAVVVDPRYPAVRQHLVDHLARAVEEWGMDGLKIDFVDQWGRADVPASGPEADCDKVSDGVARVLDGIHRRITAAQPDAMVEHRQPYVSHGLWPYVTMIRAGDCPLSPTENRQRTVALRLISGPIAVQSDMLMWSPDESPDQIAVALINVLFSVPQISVDLNTQSPAQLETLAFWLGLFRQYAAVLQQAVFEPSRPDLGYPVIIARDVSTVFLARYAPVPLAVPEGDWRELLLANADADQVIITAAQSCTVTAQVRDARGRVIAVDTLRLDKINSVTVPTGGLLTLTKDLAAGQD